MTAKKKRAARRGATFKEGDLVKATLYGARARGGRGGLFTVEGVVKWSGPRVNAWGETEDCVDVSAPGPEGHDVTWMLKASEIVSEQAAAAPQPVVERKLLPGSYGDHKDPRGAMQRLADAREAIGGTRRCVHKKPARALAQLEEWIDDPSWQELCPEGHYLGRSPDNVLDIGVWSSD